MSNLEQLYKASKENTYVGRVLKFQEASAGAGRGVDFFDGNPRPARDAEGNPAADEYQKEFTRNAAGDFRYAGGGKEPGTESLPKLSSLSRWTEKSLNIAFGGSGPVNLPTGYHASTRFTTLSDTRNAAVKLHKYTPARTEGYSEAAIVPGISQGFITGPASGPSPSGLRG
jgi:hypothetical protein